MGIPVILDTDIGLDVDDAWALAFLLKCPEIDLKLVVTNTGDTEHNAAIAAKILEIGGREDVPVAVGPSSDATPRTHRKWLGDYTLDDYKGTAYRDGIGAICDTVHGSREQVAIVCIGPLTNIAEALTRDPSITENSRIIGMHGSVRRGYLGADKPHKEYNVYKDVAACQKVFTSSWHLSITPLDTCGLITLKGDNFQKVLESKDPLARAAIENHFGWYEAIRDSDMARGLDPEHASSTLYDTVAVYMAFSEELLEMESLPIIVTDDAKTMVSDDGQVTHCAMNWKDQDAFEQLVADRIAGVKELV